MWKLFSHIRTINRKSIEVGPDEIFLDSSNLPDFDQSQFEGRFESPIQKRSVTGIGIAFFIIAIIFAGKAYSLQVTNGAVYAAQSEQNRLDRTPLFAERGVIFDRNGVLLAWNEINEGEDFSGRQYTDITGVAHVLGYVSYPQKDTSGVYYQTSFVGREGAEGAFDEVLRGDNGAKLIETNAVQNIVSESVVRTPTPGENVTLSIDTRLQSELYRLIASTSADVGFRGGAGVMMDVETGEVVAMTSFPEYDPNVLATGEPKEKVDEFVSDVRKPFLNKILQGQYTPGSIVKPFMGLAVLEEGVIHPETEIESTGSISIPNPYFPDQPSIFNDWRAHGFVDLRYALAYSSNVYFYEVGGGYQGQEGIGIENINRYMRMFGFGEETGVAFGDERTGVIPNPAWKEENFDGEPWRIGDTYNTAIGQYGFQVTPLQAVRGIAAIANGGRLLEPTLIKDSEPRGTQLNINPEHFQIVREGMRLAVTDSIGTARGLNMGEVEVAGKTGTAQLGISKDFVNSWVFGFFPYEKPRYAFVILMERGPVENLIGGTFVMHNFIRWMGDNTPEYFEDKE